jgi:hypothetical protein
VGVRRSVFALLWELGLPAMASSQPTNPFQIHPIQLWEPACWRWRPDSRLDLADVITSKDRSLVALDSSYRETRMPQEPGRPVGRLAFALAFDLLAPSRGRVEVLRSGQPGKDAGLAAPGHGWPMAAGPRSRTGARACRATARHRTSGAKPFGYFGAFPK